MRDYKNRWDCIVKKKILDTGHFDHDSANFVLYSLMNENVKLFLFKEFKEDEYFQKIEEKCNETFSFLF